MSSRIYVFIGFHIKRSSHKNDRNKTNVVYENIEKVLTLYKKYIDYILKYLEKT